MLSAGPAITLAAVPVREAARHLGDVELKDHFETLIETITTYA